MPVSYDASQLLKCTVSFTYSRYIVGSIAAPTQPSSPTSPEPSNLDTPNALGNSPGELERLRAKAAIETLDRSRTPGLLDRVVSGGARSQAGQRVGQSIFDAF